MLTDNTRELLELAAKACGIPTDLAHGGFVDDGGVWLAGRYWNPLADDGDCARMEAQLEIRFCWYDTCVDAICDAPNYSEELRFEERYADHAGDKQAARRMASTRAAAEIGRRMK